MVTYLVVVIAFVGWPSVLSRFVVPGGAASCSYIAGKLLEDPPPAVLGGHVVRSYSVACTLERVGKPT